MDLHVQRRVSRTLAALGTVLLTGGLLVGDIASAEPGPDDGKRKGTTSTTAGKGDDRDREDHGDATTSSTRPRRERGATTSTTRADDQDAAATTSSTAVGRSTQAPSTTTTTAAPYHDAPSGNPPSRQGQAGANPPESHSAAAAEPPTTTSTVAAPVSRGPRPPLVTSSTAPPTAAPVTSSTVRAPTPPSVPSVQTPTSTVSDPVGATADGAPPNPLREAAGTSPRVIPEEPTPAPGTEAPRAAEAAGQSRTRGSGQLGATGAATRSLLLLAGVALLLGALAVAYGDPGPLRTAMAYRHGPVGRQRRLRRSIPGWESGVPLAPDRREAARRRMERRRAGDGAGAVNPPGDGPAS